MGGKNRNVNISFKFEIVVFNLCLELGDRRMCLLALFSGYPPPRICILFSGRRHISRAPPASAGRAEVEGMEAALVQGLLLGFQQECFKPQPVPGSAQCLPELIRTFAPSQDAGFGLQSLPCGWRSLHLRPGSEPQELHTEWDLVLGLDWAVAALMALAGKKR